MYTIEKVIRTYGKDSEETKEVNAFFGKGRLTSDIPELREAKGYKVLSKHGFSLACDDGKDEFGKRLSKFFPLVVWAKNAEALDNIAKKVRESNEKGLQGREILIFGRLEKSSYNNKDGVRVEYDNLVVERFSYSDYPNTESSTKNTSVNQGPTNQEAPKQETPAQEDPKQDTSAQEDPKQDTSMPNDGEFQSVDEEFEDLPF